MRSTYQRVRPSLDRDGSGGVAVRVPSKVAFAALFVFVASVPLDVFNIDGIGSISTAFGALLLPATAIAILSRGNVRRSTISHHAILAFVCWSTLSYIWTMDADATVQRAITFAQLGLFAWLAWQIAITEREGTTLLGAYLIGAVIAGVATLLKAYYGEGRDDTLRFAAEGFNENDLGVTLALGIPMAWFLGLKSGGWKRNMCFAYVPLAALATALTGSRGGAVVSIVALAIIPATVNRTLRRWAALAIATMAAGAAIAYLVPEGTWNRLLSIQEEVTSGTLTNRTVIWAAGWQVLKENFLVGVGAGAFPTAVAQVLNWHIAAHNALLSVATELGIIGLLLFGAVPGLAAVQAKRCPQETRAFVWILLASWLVGGSSLSWEYRKTTWFPNQNSPRHSRTDDRYVVVPKHQLDASRERDVRALAVGRCCRRCKGRRHGNRGASGVRGGARGAAYRPRVASIAARDGDSGGSSVCIR